MEAPFPKLQEAANSSRHHKGKISKVHKSHNDHTHMFSWLLYNRNKEGVINVNWVAQNQTTARINNNMWAASNPPTAGVNIKN